MIDHNFYSNTINGAREDNICLFENCNLKSIKNYDFCYQHVDMFVKKNSNKYTVCKWRDDENSKKCNQLVLNTKKKHDKNDIDYHSNEFCFTHFALEKLRKKRKQNNTDPNKLVQWESQHKGFNEIESHLTRRNKELNDLGDEDEEQFCLADLVEIDENPQILQFSNDSSDKLMMEIIGKYTDSQSSVQIEKNIKIPLEKSLNDKVVYTKDELVKIYKLKLSKLKFMYKKQLNILNDKLVVDRKRYLLMKQNENDNQQISKLSEGPMGLYKCLNPTENYLKRKFDPKIAAKNGSDIYKTTCEERQKIPKCSFSSSNGHNYTCTRKCLPQSKFCKNHVTFDQSQVGFCNCSLTPKTDVYGPNIIAIKQINHKCCDDLIGNRYVRKEFQDKLNENLLPEHLVNIYNKLVDQVEEKSEENETVNVDILKTNEEADTFDNQSDLENKDENQIDYGTSKGSSSTVSSSSSDSSLSTTSSDSNKSILSSSSLSSTDSDDDSDMEQEKQEDTQN